MNLPGNKRESQYTHLHALFYALDGHASTRAHTAAVVTPSASLTWLQLQQNVKRIASALLAHGIKRGERCVIIAENTVEHYQLILGIARAGAVVVPMSLMLNADTLATLLADANARFVFTDQAGRGCLGSDFVYECEHIAIDNTAEFTRFLQGATDKLPPLPDVDSVFSIIYSSGTTGVPKGIVHTHSARLYYAVVFALEYGINQSSVILLTTALYSNASWMMLLPALFSGATFVMSGKYQRNTFGDTVKQYQATHALLVPTQIIDLLGDPNSNEAVTLPQVVVSAGSYLEPRFKQAINNNSDCSLFELYGNTEGVATLLRPWQVSDAPDSVGTAITTGEIAILGDDNQRLAAGQCGEIIGRSPLMSAGYFKRSDLNDELFWRDDNGRWFVRSGDLGEFNQQGMLILRGRKKDMIVSGAINVYPVDIESVLLQHIQITAAAVVAIPHPRWGETPYAFITVTPNADQDCSQLLHWTNARLNKHQRLFGLSIVDELPRNALGKVVKGQLQQQYLQEQLQQELQQELQQQTSPGENNG